MRRRLLLATPALSLTVAFAARDAAAQALPEGTVRILWGYPPGGAGDFIARLVAEHASARLGRQIVVINQPGATGLIAIDALRNARPDGATIGMMAMTNAVLMPMVNSRAKFDFTTDFESIAHGVSYSLGFAVSAKAEFDSWPGFLAWAKANPSKVLFGGSGLGSISHLFGAMMKRKLGVNLEYVPFRGGADLNNALIAGQMPLAIGVTSDFAAHHKAGKMKVLAVSTARRDVSAPDVPTFIELGHADLESEPWFSFFAPPRTPAPLLAQWNEAINHALALPAVRERIAQAGFTVGGGTPAALRARMEADKARWLPEVQASGIRMEE
ncbi:MAG: tripartite tricarboxylate transporter substrate binding protein [Rhodospirillales bacterium]|nr:tripartite tricarboxylate transporter substrate binding protein [Rhodospirillales bacterium]